MKKIIFTLSLIALSLINAWAISPDSIRFHHFDTDSARITLILDKTRQAALDNKADRIAFIARQFINTPYEAGTLEDDEELLTINLSKLDCTTLVETVIALAQVAPIDSAGYTQFADSLRDIRYRGGVIDGYTSRLHYMSDWIADNIERGNFNEVTATFPKCDKAVKTINYISTHARSYPALQDNDSLLNIIKDIESDYVNYEFPYISKQRLASQPAQRWFRNGDIILFTTSTQGLDISHMSIVVINRGVPCILHASSVARKVVIEQSSIYDYMLRNNSITGVRVIRL